MSGGRTGAVSAAMRTTRGAPARRWSGPRPARRPGTTSRTSRAFVPCAPRSTCTIRTWCRPGGRRRSFPAAPAGTGPATEAGPAESVPRDRPPAGFSEHPPDSGAAVLLLRAAAQIALSAAVRLALVVHVEPVDAGPHLRAGAVGRRQRDEVVGVARDQLARPPGPQQRLHLVRRPLAPLAVPALRAERDQPALHALPALLQVAPLQAQADPPGDDERQDRRDEEAHPEEPRREEQRDAEGVGDDVVAARRPQVAVPGDGGRADPRPGRGVARPVEDVVDAFVS